MTDLAIELVGDVRALERHRQAWESLGDRALEPNAFLEPAFLLPALRHLAPPDGSVEVLLAWRRAAGGRELVGLLPIARTRRTKRLPVRSFGTWRHGHSFLGTPLLDPDGAEVCLRAILAWACETGRPGRVLRFERVAAGGPFGSLLMGVLKDLGVASYVDERYNRPLYRPRESFEIYLEAAAGRDRRHEIRRLLGVLGRAGDVSFAETTGPEDVQEVAQQFLRLEAGGWKGRAGSAFAASPAQSAFFVEVLRSFAVRGRLLVLSLRLNGVPIAMRCGLLAGEGAFSFKTAYDEAYRRHSPGVLLEVEQLRRLLARQGIRWMDSCASGEGSPLNWLWLDRREIRTIFVPLGDPLGDLFVASLPLLKRLARPFRDGGRRRGDGDALPR